MGGLFRKIKDRITGDDERHEERRPEQPSEVTPPSETAAGSETSIGSSTQSDAGVTSTINDIVAQADASIAGSSTSSTGEATSSAPSSAPSSTEGTVTGSGLERTYTTHAGDRLEAIAAYFYGDPVQKQRLIDDNPWVQPYDGKELPPNMEIKVGEDPNRGDTVAGA